jgi:hypothetical protein
MRLLVSLPEDYIGVYGARLIYHEVTPETYGKMHTYMRPFAHETPLQGDLSARTMRDNIINFPTLVVKASALAVAGPSDPMLRKNVDWDLALRLTRQGKFGFVPEPLILTPTSMDPTVSANRVSRSKRLGGASLSKHYASTANYLMRIDRPLFARRFLRAALALTPFKPKLWAHYLFSHAPGLHAKLRKEANL